MKTALEYLDTYYPYQEEMDADERDAYNQAIDDASENAKVGLMSCGDVNTCGCAGICEHPVYFIDKQSILKLKK